MEDFLIPKKHIPLLLRALLGQLVLIDRELESLTQSHKALQGLAQRREERNQELQQVIEDYRLSEERGNT